MKSISINNNTLEYNESGSGETILLLSGWCQDHRLFEHVISPLAERFHVVALDWRGHDIRRITNSDFTTTDMVDDVCRFLDAKGIEKVLPVSTSHGGWANMGVVDKLGADRVPKAIVIDWLMKASFTELVDDLKKSQLPDRWQEGRDHLFREWVATTNNRDVINHVWTEMASFEPNMWMRSCREIEKAYEQWNSPLRRIQALNPQRPIAHIFSQPTADDYIDYQRNFAADNPWFSPYKIQGDTHFPTLESPEEVVNAIADFVDSEQ